MIASSVAPTAMIPRVSSELVPALASTAGIANTPVPMMLPMTRPVAEVRPSARAFCSFRGDICSSPPRGTRGPTWMDIEPSPGSLPGQPAYGRAWCDLPNHASRCRAADGDHRDVGPPGGSEGHLARPSGQARSCVPPGQGPSALTYAPPGWQCCYRYEFEQLENTGAEMYGILVGVDGSYHSR